MAMKKMQYFLEQPVTMDALSNHGDLERKIRSYYKKLNDMLLILQTQKWCWVNPKIKKSNKQRQNHRP
jgi:hypothetical protein